LNQERSLCLYFVRFINGDEFVLLSIMNQSTTVNWKSLIHCIIRTQWQSVNFGLS